jgi:hypothetical protein
MSQPPRNNPPPKSARPKNSSYDPNYGKNSSRGYSNPPPRDYRNAKPRYVQQQRDPFPYIMGGVIGALVIGLVIVIVLLLTNNKSNTPTLAVQPSGTPLPTTAAGSDPPRMPLDQFKALYDNPSTRPMIIDVRAAASFDEGHIAGALSFPEADVDTRVNEIPKDKLVVAYCQ